ncbi:MAG: hypothetical protein RhofKO_31550 [Rhodothermales bacterium]
MATAILRPKLPQFQPLLNRVDAWDGIETTPHQYFALGFEWRGAEIGHLHANGMLDMPLPKKLHDLLLDQGDVVIHPYRPDSGWATYHVNGSDDFDHAAKLLRLAYLHRRLVKRDATFDVDTLDAELDALDASDAVRTFFAPLADRFRASTPQPAPSA